MDILKNSVIQIKGINRKNFNDLRQYIKENNIDSFDLKIKNMQISEIEDEDAEIFNNYADVLAKVRRANLFFCDADESIFDYLTNASVLMLHFILQFRVNF